MLYKTKHCFLNNSALRWLKIQLENTCHRIMSTTVDSIIQPDINTMHGEKRPMLDDGNEIEAKIQKTETETVQRIKRKNHAILLGYLGKDYYGMQRNPGMKTIEEDLITALLKADLITAEHFENMRLISFQRAARTDKGVSAIRQIVSLKLPEKPDKTVINKFLPDVIRVFGIKRVTKGFNSKNQCDARTYRYIIPTFAFALEDPTLLKVGEEVNEDERIKQLSTIAGKPYIDYRLSPESLNRLNSILKLMEGTHNFHNFTSKVKPLDPRAQRYIIKFHCVDTFTLNGMEFAILEIKGQSFMLHQIRKMVAVVIAVARNIISEETINEAFKTMDKLEIPIAPGLGLCLCHVHYDCYGKRYGADGLHETLDWKECEEEVEKFQKEYILKHMVDTEISEQTTLKWIAGLPFYSFSNKEDLIEDDEKQEAMDNNM
ncbi:pseudouridylate synthase 1 homolog isoform X1 [Cataglyphis hispanica]|uniref:pseudouridylate synthase 1 homolog isoform X1 n=2 Tax=Cataglyphis hispanica TaxID=1086592 RepID=UPI002180638A|nr:pseudouridylate synthase 1 homolog isoform X1 [Cataglyphis hispanica]XP_050449109.1 pseudouridylate synthase 1 homolog isoform X1 [Cataglyphis hispanica]